MNYVDYLIIIFVLVSVFAGFKEGFVRLSIGFVAMIVGFVVASWFYGLVGDLIVPYVRTRAIASFLGFNIIFFGILITGGLLGLLLARVFRLIGLSVIDRTLGGAFAAVRAGLILTVALMAWMAFAPKSLPRAALPHFRASASAH